MSYRIRNGTPAEFAARAQSVAFLGSPQIPTRPQLTLPMVASSRLRLSMASPRIRLMFVLISPVGLQRRYAQMSEVNRKITPATQSQNRRIIGIPERLDAQSSILVPRAARNLASQAGCAGQAGAVTRLPSAMASVMARLT